MQGEVLSDKDYERMGFLVKQEYELTATYPTCCISPSAKISKNVTIHPHVYVGENTIVESGTVIYYGAFIGDNCYIGHNCRIGNGVVIREHTHIGDFTTFGALAMCEGNTWLGAHILIESQVHITRGATIEDWVFMGPLSACINDPDMVYGRQHVKEFKPQASYIRFGARIGTGAIINPAITIGREAVIGSGSVVTKDIPDFTVAYGVPAKPVKQIDEKWKLPPNRYHEYESRLKQQKEWIKNGDCE